MLDSVAAANLATDRSCIIITGAPGAGKSTVALLVAQALARSALLIGDQINRLIVSGHVWALGEPADEAARQVELCNRNLCELAQNFADAGFTPVIDWIVPDNDQLDYYLQSLAPRRVLLVVLAPGVDACRERNRLRDPDDQFFFDGYEALTAGMRDGFGSVGWWFDTSRLGPEETAVRIIADAPRLALINATEARFE